MRPMSRTMTFQPYRDADDTSPAIRVDEAIALRRKVLFWRRATLLIGGLVVLALLVALQRAESSRDECAESLALYAEKAALARFEQVPPELLSAEWEGLEAPQARRFPKHYKLFTSNWAGGASGEPAPLAVCEHTHTTLFSKGRNVLYKTPNGTIVQWVSESAAGPLAGQAK